MNGPQVFTVDERLCLQSVCTHLREVAVRACKLYTFSVCLSAKRPNVKWLKYQRKWP